MLRLAKTLGGLLVVLALLAGGALASLWFFRPPTIDLYFEKVLWRDLLTQPEALSRLRLLEPWRIDFHNDELTDVAPARDLERLERARRNLDDLRAFDRQSLSDSRQVSYDVLEWSLSNTLEGRPWLFHDYPVNQLFGVQNETPAFLLTAHPVNNLRDARNYVARLERFPWKFAGLLEGLRLRESQRVIPPRFAVEKVLAEARAFIAAPPEQHLLYTHLEQQLGKLQGEPEDARQRILDAARAAVARSVIPAYADLIAYLEQLLTKAKANNGAWALPDGERYYAWQVRRHTTTDLTPEQVHRIGLAEVGRIEAEMERILRSQHYTQGTVGERLAKLGVEPRFLYPDSDEGRLRILADYQAIIDEISAALDPYFGLRPTSGVKVERIPPFREKTAPGAYYEPAALDGSRPGIFFANLRDVRENYKWMMRTLAYHEAVPGHHFQIAVAQALQDVPTFRKGILRFTAYTEGWALYAEQLAREIGFQNDPYDDLGRLQAEMLRAVRLVVDTGMHHKRWTREQAIDYMLAKTGQPEGDVVSEIERYLVMPGQALAYKVGMLKILELRERARNAQGERFDLRDFHDQVLGAGSVPLTVLERRIDAWSATRAKN